jgi:hypothetical protein
MTSQWYYLTGDKYNRVRGPHSDDEMRKMFQDGTLKNSTHIKRANDNTWTIASESEFADIAKSSTESQKKTAPWVNMIVFVVIAVTIAVPTIYFGRRPANTPDNKAVETSAQSTKSTATCIPPDPKILDSINTSKTVMQKYGELLQMFDVELEAENLAIKAASASSDSLEAQAVLRFIIQNNIAQWNGVMNYGKKSIHRQQRLNQWL